MRFGRFAAHLAGLFAVIAAVAVLTQGTAFAQTARPAVTKNIDEPARTPYFYTIAAACPFANVCNATFPVVPAGKRLRVTRIGAFSRMQTSSGFLVLHPNDTLNPLLAFPVTPLNLAYYGSCIAADVPVDYYFEAGQTLVLELGTGLTWITVSPVKLRITGYLVDLTL